MFFCLGGGRTISTKTHTPTTFYSDNFWDWGVGGVFGGLGDGLVGVVGPLWLRGSGFYLWYLGRVGGGVGGGGCCTVGFGPGFDNVCIFKFFKLCILLGVGALTQLGCVWRSRINKICLFNFFFGLVGRVFDVGGG